MAHFEEKRIQLKRGGFDGGFDNGGDDDVVGDV